MVVEAPVTFNVVAEAAPTLRLVALSTPAVTLPRTVSPVTFKVPDVVMPAADTLVADVLAPAVAVIAPVEVFIEPLTLKLVKLNDV